jgi:hypothetical protein
MYILFGIYISVILISINDVYDKVLIFRQVISITIGFVCTRIYLKIINETDRLSET